MLGLISAGFMNAPRVAPRDRESHDDEDRSRSASLSREWEIAELM